ncbi:MAG TPA: NAD(P)H-quinone oxidoreductase [Pyrinomonadaceae bacterium]|nr:NAD(P)H-quinone oxidoreductase [Pyrinomonadaceae bacterium]
MKAVTIVSFGGVEGLEVREVADAPRPMADRVRVRVRAAGLNRADILQRLGRYPAPPGYPQEIPGLEFAGEVEEVGDDEARRWKVGDRVFGIIGGGGQAEFVTLPESHLAEIPTNLDWAEAASIPEVFMTAHDALFTQCGVKMGESVLIHAAGSGVGTAAIQLVRAAGAFAYGTSRTADKLERAKEFGLTDSVIVGDDPMAFANAVKEWTGDKGVDVILDLVGAAYLKANLEAIGSKGRLIFVGTTSGSKAEMDYSIAMRKRLRIMSTSLRTRSTEEKATATRLFEEQVVPLLASGAVRPVIDKVFKMEEVRAAHERIESNESFGKVVLMIE